MAAYGLRPDVAIAIDVTYATDVPAGDANEAGDHRLGGGPAIFRGPAINPRVFALLLEAAEAEGLTYTVETGMKTHTDADDTYIVAGGDPDRARSRSRSATCTRRSRSSQLADLEACVRLLVAFAGRLQPGASYAR